MANVNKVFLIGNLTRDPELRYTPNGAAVTDLGIAINRVYLTKDGEKREEVSFIDVTVWNRQAENCCQYLKKGRPVHVEGFLKMDSWDDKTTGKKQYKLKVEAEHVQFLGSRREDEMGGGGGGGGGDDYAPPPARDRAEPRRSNFSGGGGGNGNGPSRGGGGYGNNAPGAPPRRPALPPENSDDDDIPF